MSDESRARGFGGGALIAAFVVGIAAVVVAGIAGITMRLEAAALALLAGAVAFGSIATAVFRR